MNQSIKTHLYIMMLGRQLWWQLESTVWYTGITETTK